MLGTVQSGKFAPIYVLQGLEPFFVDELEEAIMEAAVPPEERSFCQNVIYGRDTDGATVASMCRQFPFGGARQSVIVREAQNLKAIEALASYAADPNPTTILVLTFKGKDLDKRSKLYKALAKHALVFTGKRLYDNKLPGWIMQHARDLKLTVAQPAADLLAEQIGNDLSRIHNELAKIKVALPGGQVGVEEVTRLVGFSKEFNVLELSNALGIKDFGKCMAIANYFENNPKAGGLAASIASLTGYFMRVVVFTQLPGPEAAKAAGVNPYFGKEYEMAAKRYGQEGCVRALKMLAKHDAQMKGIEPGSLPDGIALPQMLVEIMSK